MTGRKPASTDAGGCHETLAILRRLRDGGAVAAQSEFQFGAVILAAGFSTRMGRPKLLLPWGPTTVLGQLLTQWQSVGASQCAVVCRPDDAGIHAELDRLKFPSKNRIPNPDAARGMFSSIQCAASWAGWGNDLGAIALVLGDQPHLKQQTLERLRDLAGENRGSICQPEFAGHARHPVFLPRGLFLQLAKAQDGNLKHFLAERIARVKTTQIDDPGLALDLDLPEDYQQALNQILRAGLKTEN